MSLSLPGQSGSYTSLTASANASLDTNIAVRKEQTSLSQTSAFILK